MASLHPQFLAKNMSKLPSKDRLIRAMPRALNQDPMARIDARYFHDLYQRRARKLGLLKPKL